MIFFSDQQRDFEISKLSDISTIDGNGQLYLALQDLSMKGFQDKLDKVLIQKKFSNKQFFNIY